MAETMKTFPVRSVEVHREDIRSFTFAGIEPALPGQFVTLWLPGVDEKPFSVSNVVDGITEVTVLAVGPFSQAMMAVKVGDRVGIRGPFGRGFSLEGPALLVGGGMGIAPLRFLAEEMVRREVMHTVLLGSRTRSGIIFRREFAEDGTRFATEDGTLGRQGLVTDLLADELSTGRFGRLYACGPEAMLVAVRRLAEEHRVPYQLAMERYMKCGIGVCGQCSLDGSGIRVCKEGPVLDATDLAGVTEFGLSHRDASGRRP
jgi:dihydroorotate dehydrogenase electron transfer subunit